MAQHQHQPHSRLTQQNVCKSRSRRKLKFSLKQFLVPRCTVLIKEQHWLQLHWKLILQCAQLYNLMPRQLLPLHLDQILLNIELKLLMHLNSLRLKLMKQNALQQLLTQKQQPSYRIYFILLVTTLIKVIFHVIQQLQLNLQSNQLIFLMLKQRFIKLMERYLIIMVLIKP